MDQRMAGAATDPLCETLVDDANLALLLDLDGTLIPFAPTPEAATLDHGAVQLLDALYRAAVHVVIVSGRPQALLAPLRERVPHAWWIAEHGTWRCDGSGQWQGPSPAPEISELTAMLERFSRIPGARLETKSLSLCLHWRLVPSALRDQMIWDAALVCDEWLASHRDFERVAGVEMMEVRRRAANKGSAVVWLRERLPGAHFIALGDDDTDDDMFSALHHDELAIGVGPRHSLRTTRRLANVAAVRAFLRWLVDARTGGATALFPALQRQVLAAPAARAHLLVISIRTPAVATGKRRRVGGVVSALEDELSCHSGAWLGWSGRDSEAERSLIIDHDARPIRASFDLPSVWREHYHAGFCQRVLWPLFHGRPDLVRHDDRDWHAYIDANAEFARHASGLAGVEAAVWVHDYHLLLTGQALRHRGFRGPLGMFLHVPFPDADLLDTLPRADELLAAICAFDLVGFQTEQSAANFRACVSKRPFIARLPELEVLPVGVEPREFAPGDRAPEPEITGLRTSLGQRRMIVGIDRLDQASGIPERLEAFERLLASWPEWRGEVCLVQIAAAECDDIPGYSELRHRVGTIVDRINGRFGTADWVPAQYLYRAYDHTTRAQLYRAADTAMVTPLHDGLSLVAKEFVVAQDAAHPGALVFSKFAGAASELADAVSTDPGCVDRLAADLDRALRMTAGERAQRHARMAATLEGQTPQRWAATFLDRLRSASRARHMVGGGTAPVETPAAEPADPVAYERNNTR